MQPMLVIFCAAAGSVVLACSSASPDSSAKDGGSAEGGRSEGGGGGGGGSGASGGSPPSGNCFDGGTVPTDWTIQVTETWSSACTPPGAIVGYTESGEVHAPFKVMGNTVAMSGAAVAGNQAVLSFKSCRPSDYSAKVIDIGNKMTLTSLSGTFDPSTCEFSLNISGVAATEPEYKFIPIVGPSSTKGPATGEYLMGATIVLPAGKMSTKSVTGGSGNISNTFTVTLFEGDNLDLDGG